MRRDAVQGPIVCVCMEKVPQALNEMKTRKVFGSSEVSLELIAASGGVGIQVMVEICQRVLDGFGIPAEWSLSIVVQIFKGKGDIWKSSCYRTMKLLEHGLKVVERVLGKRLHGTVSDDEMQFGVMPERGTMDAVFILKRMIEVYNSRGKALCMCFVDLHKAFGIVQRNELELAFGKKSMP